MALATIWHNPRCSKSRQTLEILRENLDDIKIVEYLKEPLTADVLENMLDQLGMQAIDILRKGEAVYKEKFKGKVLSDKAWITAMIEYPVLIERPIVSMNGKAVIGRPPETVKQLF